MGLFRVGAVERRSRLGIRDAQKRRGHLKGLDDWTRFMRRENVCESVTPQVSPGRYGAWTVRRLDGTAPLGTRPPPSSMFNTSSTETRGSRGTCSGVPSFRLQPGTSEVGGGECDGQRQNGVQSVARPIQPVGETWLVR
jgi:hypothetical protein